MPAKRVLDLAGSLLLLLLLAPVLATAFAAVAVTSPGGAISRRTRAGLHGTPFQQLKFRTLHTGADAERAAPAGRGGRDSRLFTPGLRDDPRVTPVGRLLRRLSIDELPQLLNVVRGEMSLVGPRPLPVDDPACTGRARDRLQVLPGMTGLWQVGGRCDLPWHEMALVDLEYVDTHCLAVDLGILARTVPAALAVRAAG